MRKKLATVTAHGDQNGHSQPWLSRDLGRDWAVTQPWLNCDHTEDAMIELWSPRDWAVTSLWPLLAVTELWSLGPGTMTTVVTVTIYFLIRSRPNWITGPGPESLSARKLGSCGPENGVSRWRRPNSDIYSQNYHFGLVYDMIYQFLGMEAKNYKFGMFCQQ